jgi:hypothetical protein
MKEETSSSGSDKREFYRKPGIIYLTIERGGEAHRRIDASQPFLDQVTLRLMNFRQRLEYRAPEQMEYFEELAEILEEMYLEIMDRVDEGKKSPRSRRQSVVISGSGMDFLTDEQFQPEEKIFCHMTFTVYPFASLCLRAEVVRCEPYGSEGNRQRVSVRFDEMSEAHRESLIKFVNELERRQRIQETEKSK